MRLTRRSRSKRGETTSLKSKAVVGIEQLVNQFAKGDRHARKELDDTAAKFGVDLLLARGV